MIRWQENHLVKGEGSMKQTLAEASVCSPSTTAREVIGIDLGDRWSRYCVVNQAGTVVEENRVRTTPEALQAKFGELAATRIVIEVGAHSPWVNRLLQAQGHDVVVANPRKVRLIYESDRKNDRLDARMLARLGRVDVSLLSPVQHRSREVQADLALVRSRDALVTARTQLINSVRGMVKSMGGRLPRSTTAAFAAKVKLLIPAELKAALEPLVRSIDNLSEQILCYDERVEQLADKKYPETRLLRQVKGVGPLIALTYVLTVEDPNRFQRSRQMGSFL
jgi:transposase